MKPLFTLLLVSASLSFSSSQNTNTAAYLCMNGKSKVYHLDSSCFALKNCDQEVKVVSAYDAQYSYGRRLCGHED